jgi:hypothetical protein
MALTQTQVSQLYVSVFGRASEGEGNAYWMNDPASTDMTTTANIMLATEAAQTYFGDTINDNAAFVAFIYTNTLGKSYDDDPVGQDYWVAELEAGKSKGEMVAALITAAQAPENEGDAQDQFNNRVVVSDYTADTLATFTTIEEFTGFISGVDETPESVAAAIADVNNSVPGETFTLTNDTDVATANIFNAPMVYTPDGSDRILSLQDEDVLTGTEGRTDNTLNVTMGNTNADEGTTASTTPYLNNIQDINIDWTGNTVLLDVRNADSTESVNIKRVTADATAITVDNIGTPAANLRVANSASDDVAILFQYKQGVLTGDETLSLQLDDVLALNVSQDARGTGALIEGFEAVNLNSINGVDLSVLSVNEMETLTITGSGPLKIATLTPTAPVSTTEYNTLGAPGIANFGAVGLLDLDASAFTGDLTLDISNSLGGFADPSNSGAIVHGVVTGGTGNDAFWSSVGVAATSATNRDVIDGGAGADRLVLVDGSINGDASIVNVETLELRNQSVATDIHNIDFDAFDDSLTSVIMRDEDEDNTIVTFNLNDIGADLAGSGLVLRHSVTDAVAGTDVVVNVNLKDATGLDDTVALTVENDLNTLTTFDYTLTAGGITAATIVENVTVNDNDTESNILTLTQAQYHTGTVTLTGGVAGQSYTVVNPMVAATVDASTQLSDLRLTVGDTLLPIDEVDQDIMLGSGDDILTFLNIDDFNTADSISDVGGNDTVRAAFSDDAALTLTGIENLHILATDNVALGMANADIEHLVILADIAADGDLDASPVTAEPFNLVPATTDIITLTDSNLTELNFSADLDNDDSGDTGALINDDDSTVANFNGVTLANNSANALTVNINSALDFVDIGATAYTLGQLTAHGITSMDIVITDEDVETLVTAATALTTINNIYAKDMTSLSVTAQGDVNLNTVSGAPLNNSLLTFDASAVGGDLTANVISLGDAAQVLLADGDDTFSALGSAGKDIVITTTGGDNTITGSGQDDTITTGAGFDIVAGDRGDNVITTGAGNDTVTAKDGNDTFDVGTGIDTVTDNLATGIDATLATNTVSMSGGVTQLLIDVVGDGTLFVDQALAVGAGSDLTLSWTGATLQTVSAVLDGRLADDNAVIANDNNSNLDIITNGAVHVIGGAGGNDVALVIDQTTSAINFSGGTGNDAAVGGVNQDIFSGGTGADKLVMQNTAAPDGFGDLVVVADGDSLAASYDQVVGFDFGTGTTVAGVVAGAIVAGDDYLDLAFAGAFTAAANVNGTDVSGIESHTIAATGEVTFDTDDTTAFAAVAVGTGTGQLSLSAALAYLATNMNGSAESVFFAYDVTGDGVTADDSTFIFQDGAADTVIELVGVTGLAITGAVGAGAIGDIVIV